MDLFSLCCDASAIDVESTHGKGKGNLIAHASVGGMSSLRQTDLAHEHGMKWNINLLIQSGFTLLCMNVIGVI